VDALDNLCANIKRLRLLRGLTQQKLSEKADLEYKFFQKIESGRWPGLQLRTITRLARALDVEAWELLCPPRKRIAKKPRGPRHKLNTHG
jgi:transcriptional regulator with XRE-family HTH domain